MKLCVCTLILCCAATPLAAQSAPAGATAPPDLTMSPAAAIPVGSRVGELPSSYDDGGRRDPFQTLIAPKRVAASGGASSRPRVGLAAVAVADITVRGIVRSGATMLAILETPEKRSFVARVKDHLLDGSVQSIERDGVVFAEAADLGGPAETIRKALRAPGEEVR
jgi:hypothetical protein